MSNLTQRMWEKLGGRPILWNFLYAGVTTAILVSIFAHWAYDDPYITYRYAKNLANGLGFVYNPGQRILSTTTPLFPIFLAGVTWLKLDVPLAANVMGAMSLAIGGLCLWDLSRSWQAPWVGWAGLLLYPTFPLLLTTLGSETPLYLALCLGTIAAYARHRWTAASILAALATLTRPDAVLVPLVLGLDYWINQRKEFGTGPLRRALLLYLALLLPWVLFAWAYFGSPIPVTLVAKQHQGLMAITQRFAPGFLRLAQTYASQWFYWIEAGIAGLGLVMLLRKPRPWWIFLLWILLYGLSYSLLGVSSYYWYFAPLVVGLVVLLALGLMAVEKMTAAVQASRVRQIAGLAMAALALLQFLSLEKIESTLNGRTEIYRAVANWLSNNTPPDSLVGSLEIGIIGYYSDRPIVDFAGLLQPAVAAQIGQSSTYADTAQWTIKTYRPRYVVLHEGAYQALEAGIVAQYCQKVKHFEGKGYNYGDGMSIYECSIPPG